MVRPLSIRAKTALCFGGVFALLLVVALLGLLHLRAVSHAVAEVRDDWLNRIETLGELKRTVTAYRTLALRQSETVGFRQVYEIVTTAEATRSAIDRLLQDFAGRPLAPYERAVFEDALDRWDRYETARAEALRRIDLGEPGAAAHDLRTRAQPAFDAAVARLDELLVLARQGSQRTVARAQQTYDQAFGLTIVALAVGAAAAQAAVSWVTRNVSVPVLRVSAAMERLAQGDLTTRLAADPRGDEIGSLFAAVQGYRDSLERVLRLSAQSDTERRRFEAALANMTQGLCMVDADHRLIVCNRRYAELYGLPAELTRPGTPLNAILAHHAAAGSGPADADTDAGTRAAADGLCDVTLRDGRVVRIHRRRLADGGWIATHEDISEAVKSEALIAHMARHDALTGLANRMLFREVMERALTRVRRGERFAVLYLDLDHFKGVNDTLGHPVGDALLKAVAERLLRCVRETDTVARLGGDEFAIVQVAVGQPAHAVVLIDRILDAVAAPYDIDGHRVVVGTSIGVAMAPDDGLDPDTLLKNADMALYRAKADGRGTYRFFEPAMDAIMQERRALEMDVRLALANGAFTVAYQPLEDLERRSAAGYAALLRWRHPARGMVSPTDFIPIAEDTGLIVPLGDWLLHQACTDAATWPAGLRVAVGLAPAQVRKRSLPATVHDALAASGLKPARLELSVTEASLHPDPDGAFAVLHQLRALGVRLTLDDFGSERSSLGTLRRFPFDSVRIGRSFVEDMAEDAAALAVVRAVVGVARSLGMAVAADGVETPDQRDRLRAEGCTEAQGYVCGLPRYPGDLAAAQGACST